MEDKKVVKLKWYQTFLAELVGFAEPVLGLLLYWLFKDDSDATRRVYAQKLFAGVKSIFFVLVYGIILMLLFVVVLLLVRLFV